MDGLFIEKQELNLPPLLYFIECGVVESKSWPVCSLINCTYQFHLIFKIIESSNVIMQYQKLTTQFLLVEAVYKIAVDYRTF